MVKQNNLLDGITEQADVIVANLLQKSLSVLQTMHIRLLKEGVTLLLQESLIKNDKK